MKRCKGKTLSGERCSRVVPDEQTMCYTHAKAAGKPRKKKRPNWRDDPNKAPTIKQAAAEQRRASFDAMMPDEKFEAFEARGYTIERQRKELAEMRARLQSATIEVEHRRGDGLCIVCGEPSALDAICSTECAAAYGWQQMPS